MNYGQLPTTIGTGQPQPQMGCTNEDCESFHVLYSAERADYFLAAPAAEVTCGECGEPLSLLRVVTTIEES